MIRNYIEEGPDLSPGKNTLMEAANERDQDTNKTQEVQRAGKVALLEKNPEKDLVPLSIHLFKTNPPHLAGIEALALPVETGDQFQTLEEGVGHPEERGEV